METIESFGFGIVAGTIFWACIQGIVMRITKRKLAQRKRRVEYRYSNY